MSWWGSHEVKYLFKQYDSDDDDDDDVDDDDGGDDDGDGNGDGDGGDGGDGDCNCNSEGHLLMLIFNDVYMLIHRVYNLLLFMWLICLFLWYLNRLLHDKGHVLRFWRQGRWPTDKQRKWWTQDEQIKSHKASQTNQKPVILPQSNSVNQIRHQLWHLKTRAMVARDGYFWSSEFRWALWAPWAPSEITGITGLGLTWNSIFAWDLLDLNIS